MDKIYLRYAVAAFSLAASSLSPASVASKYDWAAAAHTGSTPIIILLLYSLLLLLLCVMCIMYYALPPSLLRMLASRKATRASCSGPGAPELA